MIAVVGVATKRFGGVQKFSRDLAKALTIDLVDVSVGRPRDLIIMLFAKRLVLTHWRLYRWLSFLPAKKSLVFHGTDVLSCPSVLLGRILFDPRIVDVITPSSYTANLLRQALNDYDVLRVLDAKIRVIPHGICLDPQRALKKTEEVVMSSPDLFSGIKAFSVLRIEYSEKLLSLFGFLNWWFWHFRSPLQIDIYGQGVGFTQVSKFLKNVHYGRQATLIDGDQYVLEEACEYDLFVLPNMSEGFGYAALEAISRGVGVVVDRKSGVSEFCSDTNSLNFDTLSGKGLFDAADVKNLINQNGDTIAATVVQFSVDDMIRRYQEILYVT